MSDKPIDQPEHDSVNERELEEGEETKGLVSNGAAMVVSRLLTAVFGWAGSVVIARTLSPEAWGQYSFVFGLLGIMAVVTDLGVGRVVISRLTGAEQKDFGPVAGSFIVLRCVLGIAGYLVALAYSLIVGLSPMVVMVVAIAGTTVTLATPANALLVLFQSRLKLVFLATWDVIAQIVQFLLILLVMKTHPTLLAFVLPAIAREVVTVGVRIIAIRTGKLDGRVPTYGAVFGLWGPMLREAIPISIGLALLTILTKIDTLMLERLDTYESVGLYAIGYKFSDVLILAVSALAVPFTTVLVRAWGADTDTFRQRTRQAMTVAALLGGLAIVGFVSAAEGVIGLLYGAQFEPASNAARLLVMSSAISGVTTIGWVVLVSAEKLKVFPWVAGLGVVLNVALNSVFIPLWSIMGAAGATIISELVIFFAFLYMARQSTGITRLIPVTQLARQGLLIAAVTAPTWALINKAGWPWIPTVAAACVLHLALSVVSKSFDVGDRIKFLAPKEPGDIDSPVEATTNSRSANDE